jgi:23S rRNA (cytidine2498-2'-O)-methyltransferase
MNDQADALLAYCRTGFEADLAAELIEKADAAGFPGWCRAVPGSGYVTLHPAEPGAAERVWQTLRWTQLVFARQWLLRLAECTALPDADRATPLARIVAGHVRRVSELRLEYPDTEAGKPMSRFCRAFRGSFTRALARQGVTVAPGRAPSLHAFFLHSGHAYLALGAPDNSAPWPLGIPRLRLPRAAPSRSTLKLDEALQTFLDDSERAAWLTAGTRAVDLGAAPGGWSWQLSRRGIHVTAVDNGPMDPDLLDDGLVTHLREDGFRYRPPRPVDWLVCDIVEQPHRIARLMGQWLARGDARRAVFNLKLPMKRRWPAVRDALSETARLAAAGGHPVDLRCKQLYHDREEVTACALPSSAAASQT